MRFGLYGSLVLPVQSHSQQLHIGGCMLQLIGKTLAPSSARLFGLFVFLVVGFCCPNVSHASCLGSSPTWTAASTSSTDVQSCFNEPLQCGDIIIIPAGSSTWTTSVSLSALPVGCASTQGVTVQGQTVCNGTPGVQVSSCVDNTNITLSGGSHGLDISNCSNTSFCTVTGITFILGTNYSNGAFGLYGTRGQVSFRVHHFHFINTSVSGGVMLFMNGGYGLVDHYLTDDTNSGTAATPINVGGDFPSRGYANWNDPTVFGSNQSIIIEDSRANYSNASDEGFFDCYYGGKVTVRYNLINGNQMGGWHGTDSGWYRGCVLGEIYNNTITNSSGTSERVMNVRSGTLLFFNNTVSGSTGYSPIALQYYRMSEQGPIESGTWGSAGRGLNWTPISSDPTNILSDINTLNAPDWAANHSYAAGSVVGPLSNNSGLGNGAGGFNYQVSGNCTSGANEPNWNQTVAGTQSDGSCTWVNVGGGTTPSATPYGFCAANPDTPAISNATCNALTPGDTATRNFDSNGGSYPFRDQPCVVHNQVVKGCYAWNNSGSALPSPVLNTDAGTSNIIVSGRDYFFTPMPGYTPYTYPDPLQTGGAGTQPPLPPTNLTVVVN
jgi:hypothetical protein